MQGGAGDDTYYAASGDKILDSDGQGTVYLDSSPLTGGKQVGSSNNYKSEDGAHQYALLGDASAAGGAMLTVDGKLIIEHYHKGDFEYPPAANDNEYHIQFTRSVA